jgi:hypothetical protein
MTAAQFQAAALDIFQNYWRIKAANALYRSSPVVSITSLDYANVPAVGIAQHQFSNESVADALSALENFLVHRLPRDLFFALIAEFESRLVARLVTVGESARGTFGDLQKRLEAKIALPQTLVEDVNEIRQRRNAMIHHSDLAHPKYVKASVAVQPRANAFVKVAALGDKVTPTGAYLAYATDVLMRYSNAIA